MSPIEINVILALLISKGLCVETIIVKHTLFAPSFPLSSISVALYNISLQPFVAYFQLYTASTVLFMLSELLMW